MRALRYLLVSCSAAAMAGAVTFTGATAAPAAAPARSHAVPSARFLAEARAVLAGYLRHNHPQAVPVGPGRVLGAGGTTAISLANWAGYADVSTTNQEFTRVSGSWTTPSVTCSAEDQVTSDWVGLDGLTDLTAEQLGTISWCYEGKPVYLTWYEMYPNPNGATQVGVTVQPGDKITASVTRSGTKYTLKLTDATNTANSFTTTATCALTTCKDTTAEWISERPTFSIGVVPQAHYNAFKITNGTETAGGTSGTIGSFATNEAITMVDATGAYALGTVSPLTGGNSFSTTWKNSY